MIADTPLTILLIEDDRAIAKVIALELEHQGHSVRLAWDGSVGLDIASKNEWDVILLDIMLPFLNGYDVCKQIRALKNTPILLLTAKDEVQDKVFGLDLGADDYLTKPFAMDELLTLFMEHPNHVLSRELILENVWGFDYYGETNVVDVYVRFLRGKIDERFQVHYLHTVRGVGYVLRSED
ncbi:response regulator transcription factor [Desulfosporosinus metallidurans]|uniref:Stage 0 sporulation protein A homolog n=1 Tax=Desulfosporosinus metallidurans TaxID=1888891 RepID=A0A1Q8QYY8_9FIRM|nr:response regulator transcription factor [Desulfosporosinus metallidurans]OLN32563.1 DNA-binding response regulator [Desulfosporosinus metallidurans]